MNKYEVARKELKALFDSTDDFAGELTRKGVEKWAMTLRRRSEIGWKVLYRADNCLGFLVTTLRKRAYYEALTEAFLTIYEETRSYE